MALVIPSRGHGQSLLAGVAAGIAGSVGAYLIADWLASRRAKSEAAIQEQALSTTSSGHSGNVYETNKAVAEYLMFHFGAPNDILPYEIGPRNALEFASRTAQLCVDWCRRESLPLGAAFDVGCAVGRTSFDLSAEFSRVVGLDFSHAFVAAANELKRSGSASYNCTVEGDITASHTVSLPAGVHPERIAFVQGDACALPPASELLPSAVAGCEKFTVIHGANLLCRLPEPRDFLNALPGLLVPGGLVVLVSPFSWLPQYTPKGHWLGGTVDGQGTPKDSRAGLVAHMSSIGFELIHEEEVPFLIREHARKFQWGCSHATIFRLRRA